MKKVYKLIKEADGLNFYPFEEELNKCVLEGWEIVPNTFFATNNHSGVAYTCILLVKEEEL